MKYAMLATLIPHEKEGCFRRDSKSVMQDAASVLQWNIYRGLCENLGEHFPLFNILPAGSFPQYYKYPFIKKYPFDKNGKNIGFCNVKLFRNYAIRAKAYRVLKQWCKGDDEHKTLFVYTLSQPFLSAALKVKRDFPSLHICAIVADLPEMSNLSAKRSLAVRVFSKIRSKKVTGLLPQIDSFVLLTKHMAEYLKITQPYCVMEGIASGDAAVTPSKKNGGKEKYILYSGTLHRKFGVLHLLEAFSLLKDPDYRLVICGVGDSEAEIKIAAKQDLRICFMGQLPREGVLALQTQATVLVNPRMNNEEFTKYSFPSKIMEYLASGVPVVAYRLDGVPQDYDEFLNYPADDSPQALAVLLEHICSMSCEQRKVMGRAAQDFVTGQKNRTIQTRKILEFLASAFPR